VVEPEPLDPPVEVLPLVPVPDAPLLPLVPPTVPLLPPAVPLELPAVVELVPVPPLVPVEAVELLLVLPVGNVLAPQPNSIKSNRGHATPRADEPGLELHTSKRILTSGQSS
jgi:hypothetical protein